MNNDNILLFTSQKRYFVKRAVYEAAMKLEQDSTLDTRKLTDFDLFDWQSRLCGEDYSEDNLRFWGEVREYLKLTRISSDSFEALEQAAIIVDLNIYNAGAEFTKIALTDIDGYTDWNLAEEEVEICKRSGDIDGVEFFMKVREYLMIVEFSSNRSSLIIVE